MGYAIAAILAYLLGCSNMALYLAKVKKVNLKEHGSGNLGTSNATLLLGWGSGIAVGAHDIGKGVASVLLARFLIPTLPHIGAVAGVACVLGHIFPFYLRFRGGKGFASYLGMTLALNWKFALVVLALVVIITVLTDYIVAATAATIVVVPVYEGIVNGWIPAAIVCIATAVILYKHRENFVRILKGTEIGLRSAIKGDKRVKQQ